tara:strand:- start:43660 stop:44247 length:588 start_codon:yes stop_codon:yes gene_type:complete
MILKTRSGFSLIELMVVVSIIGILSIIGIPQYRKFVAKARSAEVKVSLNAAFAVENVFFSEKGSFTACLGALGFEPSSSNRYYSVGFHNVDFFYGTCGTGGSGSCSQLDWAPGAGACAPAPGDGVNQFLATKSASSLPPADDAILNALPTDLTSNTFILCAAGSVSDAPPLGFGLGYDSWCMNETKTINHVEVVY